MLHRVVRHSVLISFAVGLIAGIAFHKGMMWKSGLAVMDQQTLDQKLGHVAELEEKNRLLSDALFKRKVQPYSMSEDGDLPYDESVDSWAAVKSGRENAMRDGRFLMVTFGANWCFDCRTLDRRLNSTEVADYSRDLFYFVNVSVGKFNQNADIAADLGVNLSKGIPVAIFFNTDGQVIGTTNEGQLEPARRYSSKQILNFIKDIAEQSRILAPDAVR
jgi:thioredoxin 1